jgi:GntR family transcriptional regulator, histidine utilization repressor
MDASTEQPDSRRVSLYQRILNDIRARILSGEWPPGYRIPFEHELSAEYGCSRMTANKAMSELAKSGLIERRRRSGSFVSRPRSQAAILEIHDIRVEVSALGLAYRYELVSRRTRTATEQDEQDSGFTPGDDLLDLVCLHYAGEQVFCLEERLISLTTVPEASEKTFEDVAPGPWLLGRVPWSSAEHEIRAVSASEPVAASLGVPRNTACLVVQRKTWSAELPVTNVRLTYAGNTHSLVARFTPQND